jgi:hypothetical protein
LQLSVQPDRPQLRPSVSRVQLRLSVVFELTHEPALQRLALTDRVWVPDSSQVEEKLQVDHAP